MKRFVIATTLALTVCAAPVANACEANHWISSVDNDGALVTLEDLTIWEVDGTDRVDSALWSLMDNVVTCDDKLVNVDENETVGAHKLR